MRSTLAVLLVPTLLMACSSEQDDKDYTDEHLAAYRAAIPDASRLRSEVSARADNSGALTLGGDAELARLAIEAAFEVNLPAAVMVAMLELVVAQEPTLYDSEKKEYLWGPWDNEDGVGDVLAYIKENDAGEDFRYSYAFARLMDEDVATAKPVIWGAATPDEANPDHGVGVTLWDIDADKAFDVANDPSFDAAAHPEQGKVVMLYGAGSNAGSEYVFNLAVARDFVDEDATEVNPVDSEYFYGRAVDPDGQTLHFMDWGFVADLCDASGECFDESSAADADETFTFQAAFADTAGWGEAEISGGDLASPVVLTECWDEWLSRTYVKIDAGDLVASEGSCGGEEEVSLAERGIPTLDDVDPQLMAAMTCVAEQGVEACD